ncbi:vitellogenin-like [Ceratina calcarata]|uniref:Vitellogenin-like n=1 Tax=Ceratina calcarata TaxID=156304 RepID=A0AAJ7N7P7_9HYME|nr:vitellogenin-like [Ceratina calcarata]
MWLPLTLLVLAGLVSADFEHGWKPGHEYTYLVRSRTLTGLPKLSDQHEGVLIKALLTLQAKDSNKLTGQLTRGQYAHIYKLLPKGWETEISDQMLELVDLPYSGKSFEILLKHGVIRDVVVDRSVPTWEVNFLKSVISQLQVDSQGVNVIKTKEVQAPSDNEPYGSFKAMEDSVSGKCEVQYDITPLPGHVLLAEPELVPMPNLKGDGLHIDIMKTKNFDNCVQKMEYHFGITDNKKWEPGTNGNGKFLWRSATSRVIISGNLKSFTIQSSVTTSKIFVSPRFWDHQNGLVASRMNLTLGGMKPIANPLPLVNNPESTGNLVYTFVDPRDGHRIPRRIVNSNEILTSDSISSVSSSEETNKKNELNLRSFASSASDSSSSISLSKENDFWQPKPSLEDALHIPLLPEFLSGEGKKKNENEDVEDAKQLIMLISNEIEDPSEITTKNTLDKFVGLCNGIRMMNRNQIATLEKNMKFSRNELKSKDKSAATKQNAWAVLRDAVTQAGTGPALLTIKNWIQKSDIGYYEAADVLSRIPKAVRVPTAEYVEAFFELATSQEVKDEPVLENAALIALGELIRISLVDGKSIHNRFPVHTFGRLTSKHDKTVEDKYIPYLASELKASVQKGNSPRIQTLILALGLTGHPKMLSVFEPYLEGNEKMTTFQRTLIVSTLSVLAEINPKLARSVLYKIYLNTMENHELRCTAVFLLLKTNPPLSMLQRMAEFTNIDTNKHVNSAVKSSLESLTKLSNPEWKDLAKKARTASELLTKTDYSYQFSHGIATDIVDNKRNIINELVLNYIGSDDSCIPRALYFGLYSTFGDMKTPPSELLIMMSSVKTFVETSLKTFNQDKETVKSMVDTIVKELNIVADKATPFEGNLLWSSKFIMQFMPFDRHTIDTLLQGLLKSLMDIKQENYINMNKLASYDMTLAFPTETGLPFIYTLRVPMLFKISGTGMAQMNKDLSVKAAGSVRLVCAKKVQGRIGFVTPFDRQLVGAGEDVNLQTYIPVKATLELNIPQHKIQLKTWPLKGEENARLVHHTIRPYTFRRDADTLKQAKKGKHWIVNEDVPEPITVFDRFSFKVNAAASQSDDYWDMDLNDLVNYVIDPWTSDNGDYRETEVLLNLKDDKEKPTILTVAWNCLDLGSTDVTNWKDMAQAVEPTNKDPDSEARRKEFLEEAAKGIKLAKSRVVDIELQTAGKDRASNALTLAWSESNVENKGRILMYWNLDSPKTEICADARIHMKPDTALFYDQAIKSMPKGEFDIDVRYGERCTRGDRINIKGKLTQSNGLRSRIKNTALAKTCEEQMKQGNKILRACQKAADLAMTPDDLQISADIKSETLQTLVNGALSLIDNSDYVGMNVDTVKPRNAGKNKIDIEASLSHDLETVQMSIFTPTMNVVIDDIGLSTLGLDIDDVLDIPEQNLNMNDLVNEDDEPTCMLDKTRVETFDGKDYPLRLGNCWHVVMTTFPKMDVEKPNEKLAIPEDSKVSILSRETQDGRKEVKAILGKHEILLLPGSPQVQVTVNGVNTQITQDKVYQERQGDDVVFEIFKVGDQSIQLVSEEYDVDLTFDGKRLMIQASERYLGSLRGLCGNYDGDAHNDFTGPKNCILKKPELFTASYALTKDECEGESLANAKSIQIEDCLPQNWNRASNVINDVESGRKNAEQVSWGYRKNAQTGEKQCTTHRTKIHETGDKICFTTRPVTSCVDGCSATETKTKNYQFHCMEKNERALSLKKRIEKGANPDLSQKSVSLTHALTVPVACKA